MVIFHSYVSLPEGIIYSIAFFLQNNSTVLPVFFIRSKVSICVYNFRTCDHAHSTILDQLVV